MALSKLTDIRKSLSVEVEDLQVNGITTFTGSVSIGGTLTYQDVTNVDSVGIITAQAGINVSGGQLDVGSNIKIGNAGVVTATSFVGALTGTASGNPTLTSGANNRVVTATGANALTGETGLTYDTQALRLNNTAANPQFHLTSADNGISELKFGDQSDLTRAVILYRSGSAGDALCFNGYNNTERLRITSDGNIGINDTAPPNFTGYKSLSIHGSTGGALVFGDDGTDEWEIYGGDGVVKIYDRANTQERIRISDNGEIGLGGANYGSSGQVLTSGGSGSAATWSTITGTTINNNTDHYILTGTGTAGTINGEANLQMTGNILTFNTTANTHRIQNVATGDHYCVFEFDSNRSGSNQVLSILDFKWDGDKVADIYAESGSDTTNKDDGNLIFRTSASQGSITERLRLKSDGDILFTGANDSKIQFHRGGGSFTSNSGFAIGVTGYFAYSGAEIGMYLNNSGEGVLATKTNYALNFHTNNTVRVKINGSGTVFFGNGLQEGVTEPFAIEGGGTIRRRYSTTAGSGFHFTGGAIYPMLGTGAFTNGGINLGGGSNRFQTIYAVSGSINTSDRTLKNTIQTSDLGIDFINKLNPVSYKFNDGTSGRTHYGLISQDIETVLTGIGKTGIDFAGFCKDRNYETVKISEGDEKVEIEGYNYSLRYEEFISPLIKAVQELSTEVETLKTKVATLEGS